MNKKGFTLIELLAVITLLAIIGGIATVSVIAVSSNIKKNMLEKKADMIEEAAILYGDDRIKSEVVNSTKKYSGYACKSIYVKVLIPDYLKKDSDTCVVGSTTNGCVVDPSDSENFLDNYEVILFYKNKKVRAIMDVDNSLTCS